MTLLLLSGCASKPPRNAPPVPDAHYIVDTPEPVALLPFTNAALAQYALDNRDALRLCNVDKAAVRQWVDLLKEQHGSTK
jgi:type IV pilus biogenesis protein CpaD/CtpE